MYLRLKRVYKVLLILLIICVVAFVGLKIFVNSLLVANDQIKMQYENEVKPKYKRELDFKAFDDKLSSLSKSDIDILDSFIPENDIASIQKSIINSDITCEEVVLYYLHRIKQYDVNYNSIIQLNKNALELAQNLDTKIKNNEDVGKLFGVVVLIKDNISEMTMNTASGSYALRDLTTKRDSFIVKQLKDQDAIILGKANLSEWSNFLSQPSSNGFSVLGGQTKNAYGHYDVGGSSSGSSVATSLNFSTVALGSETAGSMIYPAGQNSVIGLKPTLGLLSRDLIVPISEAQDTAGILGKTIKDVFEIFKATMAYDENDPLANNVKSFDLESLDLPLDKNYLQGKRIGILQEDSERNKTMVKELEELGAEVVEVEFQDNMEVDMMSVLNYGIVYDVATFLNHPDVNSPFKSLSEILEYNKEDAENRIPYGAQLHEDALKNVISKEKYEEVVANNRKYTSEDIDNTLRDNDIIAIVSFSNTLSGIYAPATYPALTVPAGYNEDGEPLGVTFVGSLNDDVKLLNIGYCYEQATHHRKMPIINK